MESFPVFFRIRIITFISIMMFSFLWLVLLCVEMFARWGASDQVSQSLMILFVITNTITLIMLPILILVDFRAWLDAARLLLLFVLQIGSAISGTVWTHRIQCPNQTPDDIGVCQLIGVYTMIACWIIPAILIFYSTYFAVVVYLQSRIPVVVEHKPQERRSEVDLEMGSSDSLSLWREKLKEIVRAQSPSTPSTSAAPRPLMLPTMTHGRQLSLPQMPSSLPNAPRRQSTMPSSHNTEQPLPPIPAMPNRHRSVPAFKHGDMFHLRALHALTIPRPLAADPCSPNPQTPRSEYYSIPSSANSRNRFPSFGPGAVDIKPPEDQARRPRHLSMTPSSREMERVDGNLPTTPRRARLSKPVPGHLLYH